MTEKIVNKLKHINADKSLSSHIFFDKKQIFYIATIFVRKHNKRKLFSIELSQGPHVVVVARDKLPSPVLRGAPG